MTIAHTLHDFMRSEGIRYDILTHPRTYSSSRTAEAAHVPGDRLAKAVLLEDENGYLLAVLPASHRIALGELHRLLQRQLGLATEEEIAAVFPDCEPGAIPPFGTAYGIETILDDTLLEQPEVYFEAGDHEELIHVSGEQFRALVAGARHARFSRHA